MREAPCEHQTSAPTPFWRRIGPDLTHRRCQFGHGEAARADRAALYTCPVSDTADIDQYARDVERVLAWFNGADDPETAARFGVGGDDQRPTVDALAAWIVDCEHLSVHPHPGEPHGLRPHSTTVVLSEADPPVRFTYSYDAESSRLHHPAGERPLDPAVVGPFLRQWLPHPGGSPQAPDLPRTAEEWGDVEGG